MMSPAPLLNPHAFKAKTNGSGAGVSLLETWTVSVKTIERARALRRARRVPPTGWAVIPYGASDMTECGCAVGKYMGIPFTPIAWTREGGTYGIQCLNCGAWWTRSVPARISSPGLCVDGSHPEVRAMRESR